MDNQNDQSPPMDAEDEVALPDELTMLKERARMMGISFSNNISVETLRKKISDRMEGVTEAPEPQAEVNGFEAAAAIAAVNDTTPASEPTAAATSAIPQTKQEVRANMIKDHMRLVRVRITNLDPKKKDLPGEVLCVANEIIGTVRKFIPYGEVTDDGYHIPYCLFRQLEKRRFLHIRVVKDRRTNITRPVTKWVKEFALDVLDPLTKEELNRLATAQMAAGSLDSVDD